MKIISKNPLSYQESLPAARKAVLAAGGGEVIKSKTYEQ